MKGADCCDTSHGLCFSYLTRQESTRLFWSLMCAARCCESLRNGNCGDPSECAARYKRYKDGLMTKCSLAAAEQWKVAQHSHVPWELVPPQCGFPNATGKMMMTTSCETLQSGKVVHKLAHRLRNQYHLRCVFQTVAALIWKCSLIQQLNGNTH